MLCYHDNPILLRTIHKFKIQLTQRKIMYIGSSLFRYEWHYYHLNQFNSLGIHIFYKGKILLKVDI